MNMKLSAIAALLVALTFAGCSKPAETPTAQTPAAVSTTATPATAAVYAYAEGSKKKGDKGLCVICVVNDGAKEEEVAAESIDYEGKTYLFCNEEEKAVFISEPAKFAVK